MKNNNLYQLLRECRNLILFLLCIGCSNQAINQNEAFTEIVLQEQNEDFDFSVLDEIIGDKRIVAIGESSHGLGKFFELKSALVQYLHQNLGFEVLAMESSFGDINLAWTEIETLEAVELRNTTLFGNFRCAEIMPLFDYIKTQSQGDKPLIYAGFDPQVSSSYFSNKLDSILIQLDQSLFDSLQVAFASYYQIYPASSEEDSTNFNRHKNKFIGTIRQVKEAVVENQKLVQQDFQLDAWQLELLYKTLDGLVAFMNFSFSERLNNEGINRGIVLRDELMFANVKWLMKKAFSNKKIIIWGHNSHIQKSGFLNSSTDWMGHFLKDEYGDDYYSLGLFAYKGKAYQHWTKKSIKFENSAADFIERKMGSVSNQTTFLDFNQIPNSKQNGWPFQALNALEMENGGVVRFVPAARFDGIINVFESDIPTY